MIERLRATLSNPLAVVCTSGNSGIQFLYHIFFVKDQFAAVLLHKPVTVTDLQDKYNTPVKKVRVLIVPGHEPGYGGTDFQGLLERDLNVYLAEQLGSFLKNNGKYDVLM